jgi:hypothetical protein
MAQDWLAVKPRRSGNAWFLADLIGGTDETPFGDLRVARGYRVRSATPSAAGRNQPAAPAAGSSPAAAEVTLGAAALVRTDGIIPGT